MQVVALPCPIEVEAQHVLEEVLEGDRSRPPAHVADSDLHVQSLQVQGPRRIAGQDAHR
jgi:hypothetical protein